jgi:hypothetical protein
VVEVTGTVTPPRTATRRVAIVQSNYVPWKGYFDLVRAVDEFMLYDDMQYTRRDWRNRNRIKTRNGLAWLTVPVQVKGNYDQRIRDTKLAGWSWAREHWETIRHTYAKAPHFDAMEGTLGPIYQGPVLRWLSDLNRHLIQAVLDYLGTTTRLTSSADYVLAEGKTERLVDLCRQARATEYLSGPSAKGYIEPYQFDRAGIGLRFADYSGYPEYPQFFPPFEHGVSIIDLLAHAGLDSLRYMTEV